MVHARSAAPCRDGETCDSVPGLVVELTPAQLITIDDCHGRDGRSPKYSREFIVVEVLNSVNGYTKTIAQTWLMDDARFQALPSRQYLCSMGAMLQDRLQLMMISSRYNGRGFLKIDILDNNLKKRGGAHLIPTVKQQPQCLEEVAVLMNCVPAFLPKWKIPEEIPKFVQKMTAIGVVDVKSLKELLDIQCDSQVTSLLRHASQPALSLQALSALRLILVG